MPYVNSTGNQVAGAQNSSAAATIAGGPHVGTPNITPKKSAVITNAQTNIAAGMYAYTAANSTLLNSLAGYGATAANIINQGAYTTAKTALTQTAIISQLNSLGLKRTLAQQQQGIELSEFQTQMKLYKTGTPTSLFTQQRRKYQAQTQAIKASAAARGASSSAGEQRTISTLAATNQFKMAQLLRQQRMQTLSQKAEQLQYQTSMQGLATRTRQLNLAKTRLSITTAAKRAQINFSLNQLLANGQLTTNISNQVKSGQTLVAAAETMYETFATLGKQTKTAQTLLQASFKRAGYNPTATG